MRISDVIEALSQYDPNTEIVIDVDGAFVSPKIKKQVVAFKHNYNGVFYKDDAVVLSNK